MARLAWPADALRRENINKDELAAAGNGDEAHAPPIVAILGDSRLKHWDRANSIAFSPDDRFVVTTSSDRTVRVWEVAGGRQVQVLVGHAGAVLSADFSPDGMIIASAGIGPEIRLWETATGQQQGVLQHETSYVSKVAFSPDGRTLASAGTDGRIVLWDPANKRQRRLPLAGHRDIVSALSYSPDGKWLASGGRDKTVRIWNAESGECVQILTQHTASINSVTFSPGSDILAAAGDDKTVKIWRIPVTDAKAEPLRTLTESAAVRGVVFHRDAKTLTTAGADCVLRSWTLDAPGEPRTLATGSADFTDVALNHAGSIIASTNAYGRVQLLNVATDEQQIAESRNAHEEKLSSASFTRDGKTIVTASYDGTIRYCDAFSGRHHNMLRPHAASFKVRDIALSRDQRFLFAAFQFTSGSCMLFEFETGRKLATVGGYWSWAVAVSPDGKFVATGNRPSRGTIATDTIAVWDTATWKRRTEFPAPKLDIVSVAFSPDGKLLSGACADGTVWTWDVGTGAAKLMSTAHESACHSVDFSPDGQHLATTGRDCLVKIWDVAAGQCIHTLSGHTAPVRFAKFSPDGRILASSANDGTVHLWDPDSGKLVPGSSFHLGPPGGSIWRMDFSPEGRHLMTANQNGTAYVLRLRGRAN